MAKSDNVDEQQAAAQETVVAPEGEGRVADAAPLDERLPDLTNTYENGIPGAPINMATPQDATVITNTNDALEAGYFGYAAGAGNHEVYTLAEAGKRNDRLAEQRINQSAAAEDAQKA